MLVRNETTAANWYGPWAIFERKLDRGKEREKKEKRATSQIFSFFFLLPFSFSKGISRKEFKKI